MLLSILGLFLAAGTALARRPNFLFILTDDQDAHMSSLDHMPQVQEHLVSEGALFTNHFCTVAICCPSRVNLWTGQMSHNTNVTNVDPPWGGYPKFVQNGYNEHHLALWMQQSGYNTYYTGKLYNGHRVDNYNDPHVSGYTGSEFFLDPYTYEYYNVTTTRNGGSPVNHKGEYSSDLLARTTQEFLAEALGDADKPFFITAAPIAPHSYMKTTSPSVIGPPEIAPRHQGLFANYTIPRTDNFNPEKPSSVNWIAALERLNDTAIDYNDEYQRLRLRSLLAVDEMVGDLIQQLEEAGALDNTYVIYSSDNGFHIGQHRLHPGKMCGLDTDIKVPMVIRGPGIPAGSIQHHPSTHTDLAPTIMQLAGNMIDDKKFDGTPMALGIKGEKPSERREHVAVEFWGTGLVESKHPGPGSTRYADNTYKGIRIAAPEYGFYYAVWCNNAKELYDMKNDPGQINNLLAIPRPRPSFTSFHNQTQEALVDRLDALLMVLKSCRERTCIDPWGTLHPGGDVGTLADALKPKYDGFYASQVKVEYERCEPGYILDAEGPQSFYTFDKAPQGMNELKRDEAHWSWYT